MTPKNDFYEQIDDYCLNLLDAEAKARFETEMKLDAALRNEVKLRNEIQSAIEELDVTNLRNKLKSVSSNKESAKSQKEYFELFQDFTDFKETEEELSPEELIKYFDSMPKVHVYQHELTSNENIHQFYKEQAKSEEEDLSEFDDYDMDGLEGLEEAILEKDIIEFRQTLNQVAKSVEPQYTVEEIDDYLNNELEEEELREFERELMQNSTLQEELNLHEEVETALKENAIMGLRDKVSQIIETETSWNVSEQSIEEFIDGELQGEMLEEFNAELSENSDLMAEVELRKQVNDVIGEIDIRELKFSLAEARKVAEENKVRRLLPESNNRVFKFLKASAAIMVLLLGIASLMNSGYVSSERTYYNFWESPGWAAERSVAINLDYMQKSQLAFINEDYEGFMTLRANAPENLINNPVYQFYSGASMQNLEIYNDAIREYTKVIDHGDNLFIEEAEWYRSLCYIKTGDIDKAKLELMAVIDRNGFFKDNSKAVLRRLKFSLE